MKHVDHKDELTELAKRIRSARSSAHLSQHALGKSVGLSDKAISAYEKGRSQPPLENLRKIADATNYPLTYFTQEENSDVEITAKLLSIERELAEVKRLLKKARQ
jgi:transcriptional regulator with XRE-family HTH domain